MNLLNVVLNFGTLLQRQQIKFIGTDGLSIHKGKRLVPGFVSADTDMSGFGKCIDIIYQRFLLIGKGIPNIGKLLLNQFAVKRSGDFRLYIFNQAMNGFAERSSLSRRNPHRLGAIFIFEIVDHAPVVRNGKSGSVLKNNIPDNGRFTGSRIACDKNIISLALHVQTEIDRLNRTLLPDNGIQWLQLGSVVELKLIKRANAAQKMGRQFL